MTNGVTMKHKQIMIPFSLQNWILDQLHSKHMGIEKTWLLARELVYQINMKADIECVVKQCATCLEYQQIQLQEEALHYEILCRLWEVADADTFMINGKTLLCVVDYDSQFPEVKKVNSLSTDSTVD